MPNVTRVRHRSGQVAANTMPDVPAPRIADPVDGLTDVERSKHLAGSRGAVVQGVPVPGVGARAMARPGDDHQASISGECLLDALP